MDKIHIKVTSFELDGESFWGAIISYDGLPGKLLLAVSLTTGKSFQLSLF